MNAADTSPRTLATAVVTTALELFESEESHAGSAARMDDALISSAVVRSAIVMVPERPEGRNWKQIMTRLAISLGRGVVKLWTEVYPDRMGPVAAIVAAEAWAACPCELHADAAAETMQNAAHQAMNVWRTPPKSAAWAGRTAAWVADAPKYGWQTVTAIVGACRAMDPERVVSAAERFFDAEVTRS